MTTVKDALKWRNEQTVNSEHLIEHVCVCTYECGNTVRQINSSVDSKIKINLIHFDTKSNELTFGLN